MKLRALGYLPLLPIFAITGCVYVPLEQTVCDGCKKPAKVSYAVTRPMVCNDYPVTYRVTSTEAPEKVFNIDKITLENAWTQGYPYPEYAYHGYPAYHAYSGYPVNSVCGR